MARIRILTIRYNLPRLVYRLWPFGLRLVVPIIRSDGFGVGQRSYRLIGFR